MPKQKRKSPVWRWALENDKVMPVFYSEKEEYKDIKTWKNINDVPIRRKK
jgi:hypothetical protein